MLLIRLHKPEDGNIYSPESGGRGGTSNPTCFQRSTRTQWSWEETRSWARWISQGPGLETRLTQM